MKNILLVESHNDKYFVEALVKYLNLSSLEISEPYLCCGIESKDIECMGDLSQKRLEQVLMDIEPRILKEGIDRIGILIDQDQETEKDRLQLVNDAIQKVFGAGAFNPILAVSKAEKLIIDSDTSIEISCFFTNVDGQGELETLLKAIKNQDSPHADCLASWRDCLEHKGIEIKNKDFDKHWIDFYIRYDTCTKKEKTQAARKCSKEAAMSKPIWNFEHPQLTALKAFLQSFN